MTAVDREWQELGVAWRDLATDPGERIRAMVSRQDRTMRRVLGFEIALSIAALGVVAWVVARNPSRSTIAWAVAALIHSALVWAFAIWNRRGIWRPMGETTRAYLSLAIERALRERRAARFVIVLVVGETALVLGWTIAAGGRSGWHWIAPALVVLGFVGWATIQLAGSPRRLARLRALERELHLDDRSMEGTR